MLIEREDLSVLMASVAAGDRLAFKHLYDRTSARLLGIVRRIVRDRALAEEVLQEVYLRIWERAASYRTELGSALTWMTSIARHRAIDVLRQHKEIALPPMDDGEDWLERVAGPVTGKPISPTATGCGAACSGSKSPNAAASCWPIAMATRATSWRRAMKPP